MSTDTPAQWRMVPVEPTTEMLAAAEKQWMLGSSVDMAKREWAAMLAAAPTQAAEETQRLRDELQVCCELKRQYQEQAATAPELRNWRRRCARMPSATAGYGLQIWTLQKKNSGPMDKCQKGWSSMLLLMPQ